MKTFKNFTACMTLVAMMILGTMTASAKTNADKHHDKYTTHRTECHLRHMHDAYCGGMNVVDIHRGYPGMDRRLLNHIVEGRHIMDRHHKCEICHFTLREIRHMEHSMGIDRRHPARPLPPAPGRPMPHRR